MKRKWMIVAALAVVSVLVLYMVTYTVSDNETAIVKTFGAADEGSVVNADGKQAGIHFKLPAPIQSVVKLDSRVGSLNSPLEELRLADGETVIVGAYMTWRIKDPLKYTNQLVNSAEAEKALITQLRSAMGELQKYKLTELTNTNSDDRKLAEAEKRIHDRLSEGLDELGIEVQSVGIRRLGRPETVTTKMFEEMSSQMAREAQEARDSGDAEVARIKSDADLAKSRIESFAELYAQEIRSEGDRLATRYYVEFQKNQDLAIELRKITALEEIMKRGTSTVVLDPNVPPFDLFNINVKQKNSEESTDTE